MAAVSLLNADCAEDFDVAETKGVEPGTVMVLSNNSNLVQCNIAYDKKVVGVVSGGGNYKPGIILDKKITERKRVSLALLGKVYYKVDTRYSKKDVGDLLTTSPSKGYALKAIDPTKSFGTIIRKALSPSSEGCDLIPILVTLQ